MFNNHIACSQSAAVMAFLLFELLGSTGTKGITAALCVIKGSLAK